jgi:hypothetical protein
MLRDVGWFVLELKEGTLYIVLHGDVNVAFGVVPVEVQTAVEVAFPINGGFVVVVDGVDEMEGIGFGEVFYSEVVNAECQRPEVYFMGA